MPSCFCSESASRHASPRGPKACVHYIILFAILSIHSGIRVVDRRFGRVWEFMISLDHKDADICTLPNVRRGTPV